MGFRAFIYKTGSYEKDVKAIKLQHKIHNDEEDIAYWEAYLENFDSCDGRYDDSHAHAALEKSKRRRALNKDILKYLIG